MSKIKDSKPLKEKEADSSVPFNGVLGGLIQVSKEDLRKLIIQCDYACIFLREAKYGGKAEALKALLLIHQRFQAVNEFFQFGCGLFQDSLDDFFPACGDFD